MVAWPTRWGENTYQSGRHDVEVDLFSEIVIHDQADEQEHERSAHLVAALAPAHTPSQRTSQYRTMERCLSLFHLQGFSITCFTWVYAFTDQPFASAWAHGGPPTIVYGEVFAICGTALVTLSLAEVASACPSIGGLYYFSARLAPQAYKGVAGFMTAHCNIIGVLTALSWDVMTLAGLVANIRFALSYDYATGSGQQTSNQEMFYIYTITLLLLGILASVPGKIVSLYCTFAAFLSLITFFSLSVTILIMAPTHNTTKFVFQSWQDHSADTGIHSKGLSFLMASQMAVSLFTGWDTIIYMSEEVVRPTYTMPAAMLRGFTAVAALGGGSLIMLLFSIQDPNQLYSSTAVYGGTSPVSQALWDVTQASLQSGSASAAFLALVAMSMFLMCLFLVIGTSRKLYAMSRDHMCLGSSFWSVLHPSLLIPLKSIWAVIAAEMLLGLTFLAHGTGDVYYMLIATSLPLTLFSYLLPIIICLRTQERLQPGPWNMGKWGPMVRIGAVVYLLLALFIVMLPSSLPYTATNLPSTPMMAFACVLVLQVCWWLPVIGGRHFYSGPGFEGVGCVRFAITSPVLTSLSRRARSHKAAAGIKVVLESVRVTQAASQGSKSGTKGLKAHMHSISEEHPYLGKLWGWLVSKLWFAGSSSLTANLPSRQVGYDGDLDSCRPSPNNFFRQSTLRIPGEKEALSRAQHSPTHPSGYAWDREAAKRLGHQEHIMIGQKSFLRR